MCVICMIPNISYDSKKNVVKLNCIMREERGIVGIIEENNTAYVLNIIIRR